MERREQITRIIEAVYDRGQPPEANKARIKSVLELADELESANPAPFSAGPRPIKPADKQRR